MTPVTRHAAFETMKILMLSILPVVLLACNVPMEAPAEAITVPPLGTEALCDPYRSCSEQGPCTCPAGFVCGSGSCVRSVNPYIECNSTQDCITTSVPYAGTCWTPICYNPGVAGAGCGWDTLNGGQACKKPNGQNGVCASGMDEGDCI